MTDKPRPRPSLPSRRSSLGSYFAQIHNWPKGPYKSVAGHLCYLLRITLEDLTEHQQEIVRLRERIKLLIQGGSDVRTRNQKRTP